MAEWSNAADSKSVIGLVSIWGSNPHLSAINMGSEMLKKIFVFIFIILVLILSSKVWLDRFYKISFDVQTEKPLEIQVFYIKNLKDGFQERFSVKTKVVPNQVQNIKLRLPTKRVKKIRIDIGSNPGNVEISNIHLKGLKTTELKLDHFIFNQIDSHRLENGTLLLTSAKHDPFIIYQDKLKARSNFKIKYLMLFGILCPIFLVLLILSKIFQKIPNIRDRFNLLFCGLFFICLCIPMLNISDAEKSAKENRMLAKKPLISNLFDDHKNYGKEFESWFNDRFYKRDTLIKFYNLLSFYNHIIQNNGGTWIKESDWMFNNDELKDIKLPSDKKTKILHGLNFLNQFCLSNHIQCYIEIAPIKTDFTKGELSLNIKDELELWLPELNHWKNLTIINPYSEFKKAEEKDYIYHKTDHHWTQYGAFIGYQLFLTKLKDKFKIKTLSPAKWTFFYDKRVKAECGRNFWRGYTCQAMGLNDTKCPLQTEYRYYHHLDLDYPKGWCGEKKEFINTKATNPQKIVIIGNSFMENMTSFLNKEFKYVKRFRSNIATQDNLHLSRWAQEIIKWKPKILLIVIHSKYAAWHLQGLGE